MLTEVLNDMIQIVPRSEQSKVQHDHLPDPQLCFTTDVNESGTCRNAVQLL